LTRARAALYHAGLLTPRALSIAAVSLALAAAGCARERGDGQSVQRAQRAESEFRSFGRGRFRVITFSADAERLIEMTDDYHLAIPLYEVPFAARVVFTADFDVPDREARRARVGTPGWTVDRLMDDVQASLLFGSGHHTAGDEVDVEGAAMFDRLETGWRYRSLDTTR
jgi:hypothetical protein